MFIFFSVYVGKVKFYDGVCASRYGRSLLVVDFIGRISTELGRLQLSGVRGVVLQPQGRRFDPRSPH